MKIFDAFWKPSFYQNKEGKSFWFGLLRVLLVNFVISIIYASVFYVSIGKNIPEYFDSFSNQAIEGYPNDLVLSIKDGILSKNISGDLKLYPFSKSLDNTKIETNSIPRYLISIDETKEASLSSFMESNAFVFFGKDGLISKSNNDIKVLSYQKLHGIKNEETFSKATLISLIDILSKYKSSVAPIVIGVIIVLYTILISIWQLLFVLFLGLVIMLLSKWILRGKTGYSDSYIYSLYAIPSISILEKIFGQIHFISVFISKIPLFTTLLTMFFLWFMFRKVEAKIEQTEVITAQVVS